MTSTRAGGALLALTTACLFALRIEGQQALAFDAASVKLNTSGGNGYPGVAPGGKRFTATNLPMTALIMLAYDVTPAQISGVPSALDKVGYDIEATCDHPMTKEGGGRMLQTLLADRFKLVVHREEREQPIYALIIAKGGPKLHESSASKSGPPEIKRNGSAFVFGRRPMSSLALILSQIVGRTVADKTGLGGRYNFTLEYAPERTGSGRDGAAPADTDGPSIFTALPQQLGLTLDAQKGQIEFIVVDHAETPSAN